MLGSRDVGRVLSSVLVLAASAGGCLTSFPELRGAREDTGIDAAPDTTSDGGSAGAPPDASDPDATDAADAADALDGSGGADAPPPTPPLGNACIGETTGNSASADAVRVTRFVLAAGTKFDALVAYLDGGGGPPGIQLVRGVIYGSQSGAPGALVAATTDAAVGSGSLPNWWVLSFASPVTLGPGEYWLGLHTGPAKAVLRYGGFSSAGAAVMTYDTFADGPSATFGAYTLFSVSLSIYARPLQAGPPPTTSCPNGAEGGT